MIPEIGGMYQIEEHKNQGKTFSLDLLQNIKQQSLYRLCNRGCLQIRHIGD
jgi:hypothetical protein